MANEKEQSTRQEPAQTPEQAAQTNAAIALAVQEAVKSVFANLAPVLKDMAMTPEKIREANRPYEDPAKIARELRESLKSKADEEENRKLDRARKDACPHLDKNGRSAICVVHNHQDHQPRGICVVCTDWIHPKEWRYAATPELALALVKGDKDRVKGRAYVTDPHPSYRIVMQLDSMS